MQWVYDPHRGGVNIPEHTKDRTRQRILAYAEQQYRGKYVRIAGRSAHSSVTLMPVLSPFSLQGGTKRGKRHWNACTRTRSDDAVFGIVARTGGVWPRIRMP